MANLDRYEPIPIVSKKCLFGLIEYTRITSDGFNYKLRIFGITIASRKFEHGIPTVQLLFFKHRLNSNQRTKRLVKDTRKQGHYECIFVLFNNLGETRLFLESIRSKIPKNTLFVYTKPYHGELLNMIIPDIDAVYYPEYFSVHFQADARPTYFENPKVFLIGLINYFKDYEQAMQSMEIEQIPHFYKNYLDKVGGAIGYESEPKTIKPLTVPKAESDRAIEKLKLLIGNNKFVIICNETFSNINLNPKFYQDLSRKLYELGYKVFFNSTGVNSSNCLGIVSSMSIQELVVIASHAEFVIGIRSGILDVIASNAKSIIALYTPFRKRSGFNELSAEKVLAAFSLSKISFENKPDIREFIISDNTSILEITNHIPSVNEHLNNPH